MWRNTSLPAGRGWPIGKSVRNVNLDLQATTGRWEVAAVAGTGEKALLDSLGVEIAVDAISRDPTAG
jgi:hypothetical protein